MAITSIYFEAQTGMIREQPPSRSNFYQYCLSSADRPALEAAISKAQVGSASLQYEAGFVETLEAMELKHRRELIKQDRPWGR